MKRGDLLIWNSGFGFDVCEYIEDIEIFGRSCCRVLMLTGNMSYKETAHSKEELLEYSTKLHMRLTIEYNRDVDFNKDRYLKRLRKEKLDELKC